MTVFLLLLCFQQKGTFYAHYDSGIEKLQTRDYEAAISELEKAVALRPDASPNARTYGVQMRRYFPYHQLAWAYLWTKDFEKASEYLKKAYAQKEDQDGGENVRIRMSMIQEAVDNLALLDRPDPGNVDKPKQKPNLGPVAEMLLKGDLKDAYDYIKLLQASYPEDPTLRELERSTKQRMEELTLEQANQDAFNKKVAPLIAAARKAETDGDLETALQRFDQIVRIDESNSEARAARDRVRRLLADRGKDEVAIQKLLEEKDAEKDEALKKLQDELRESRALLEASRLEATQLQEIFNQQVREAVTIPRFDVKWNFFPLTNLTAKVTPIVTCTVPMKSISLLINNVPFNTWDAGGKRKFAPPGLVRYAFEKHTNRLDLKVVDINGNVFEDGYDYTFPRTEERRFTRNQKTAVAVIIGTFIALIFFMNLQRRRRAFRERFNPYVAGAPILTEKMFYGRSPLLKQILNALHNNSLMVYGERRIGKTSFLHRLHNTLPHVDDDIYTFIPVFIDLQGVSEQEFFATLDHEIGQSLLEQNIPWEPPEEPPGARQFISRLRKNIGLLKGRCPKKPKLVLLLDEVDVMNSFSEKTNQQLRSVFMKGFAEHIVAVMAGIHINTKWKSEGSPWYNFFEQIELKPFSRAQAEQLIHKPVNGIYSYTPDAVERILEITGGKPYLIQKMCLNLVSYILLHNKRKITTKEVDLVFQNIEKEFYGA